jgi:hypothetical protein
MDVCLLAPPLLGTTVASARRSLPVKPHRFLLTPLAAAVVLALAPANAAAQQRGRPAHGGGGRSVVVARPAYRPSYYGYHGYTTYRTSIQVRGVALQLGGR